MSAIRLITNLHGASMSGMLYYISECDEEGRTGTLPSTYYTEFEDAAAAARLIAHAALLDGFSDMDTNLEERTSGGRFVITYVVKNSDRCYGSVEVRTLTPAEQPNALA